MSLCIVCERETVCAECGGFTAVWIRYSAEEGGGGNWWPCNACTNGLSHTHPRRERKAARKAAIKKRANDLETARRIAAGELVEVRVRFANRWVAFVATPNRIKYDDTGSMIVRIGTTYHNAEIGGPNA